MLATRVATRHIPSGVKSKARGHAGRRGPAKPRSMPDPRQQGQPEERSGMRDPREPSSARARAVTPEELERIWGSGHAGTGGGGEGGPGDDQESSVPEPSALEQAVLMAWQAGATKGTVAVLSGFLLGLEGAAGCRFDLADLGVGMLLVLPTILADAAVLVPDHGAADDGVPAGGALLVVSDDSAPGGEVVNDGGANRPSLFVRALRDAQRTEAFVNPGVGIPFLSELVVILSSATAEELLQRGVGVAFLCHWWADRLYEAGLDDVVAQVPPQGLLGVVPGGAELHLGVLAAWLAVGSFLGIEATGQVLSVQRAQRARGTSAGGALSVLPRPGQRSGLSKEEVAQMEAAARSIKRDMVEQGLATDALMAFRALLDAACLSAAYAATGNLAASMAAAVVSQAIAAVFQRRALRRIMLADSARMLKVQARLRKAAQKAAEDEEDGAK
ncbi:unnamed protein product [Pedinophyceae sp. YPF-701]|nr:unnamed protein product [Pedinophyceae sp. YPF-701]